MIHDVVIIGAGISGLSTAAFLKMKGISSQVLEKSSLAGGTMTSLKVNGYLIDFGPNTIVLNNNYIMDIIRFAGMESQLCYADPCASKRFVVKKGVMIPLPSGSLSFFKTGLFSATAKLRLLKEPFIGKGIPGESVSEFVTRRLGKEFLDYAVNPFISGVYAGDPSKLIMKWAVPKIYNLEEKYGSLLKGAVLGLKERKKKKKETGETAKTTARICNFINGIGSLPQGIVKKMDNCVETGCIIKKIKKEENGFSVEYEQGKSKHISRTRSIILAVPSYEAEILLKLLNKDFQGTLDKIPYAPVTQVFMGFAKEQIKHPLDGFGVLFPEAENSRILGALMNSSLFPGRAPNGFAALNCFAGGMLKQDMINLEEDELIKICLEELKKVLPITGQPGFVKVKKWRQAIPQYHMEHPKYLDAIKSFEEQYPGLHIKGNFRDGISVGDCILQAKTTAENIEEFLKC